MNPLDVNLFWWNPLVRFLENGLRLFAAPLQDVVSPGLAGGLAIILFTIAIRLVLLPLSLAQVRSQKAQMALQPELKALQRKYKGDREGLARAQMALYRERGVNPTAGCLPLLVQMPILIAMYWAMLNLSTIGLTLDQATSQVEAGRVTYEARRDQEPLPMNQFVLATLQVSPRSGSPITLDVPRDAAQVSQAGADLLDATQGLTLNPGQPTPNVNPPSTPNGRASIFLRPGGVRQPDGSLDRNVPVQVGQPYLVEVEVHAPQTKVDATRVAVTYDPALLEVGAVQTPELQDLPFKSRFLWLPSLGEPDLIYVGGLGIPGLLLLLMTITSYVSQRMVTMPTDDPQQQVMMRTMAFMPFIYLIFFLQTPAGLVLYWLVSNLATMVQQYFTTGLGLLAGDLQRLTGRDFQPPWAHQATSPPPLARDGRVREGDGDDDSVGEDSFGTTPARRQQLTADARRARAAAGKGRRRGKR
ncbi:MAG TPA: YidC/Oxa1 family membrane protein insertase [Chloroflexota bacterium]|nr:YidC/Oxa1 family membrane protein insertase [Chloroflexota bacterium]